MKPHQQSWSRLVEAARRAPAPDDAAVPYGFATRVAALGLAAAERPMVAVLFERFSLRAMGIACLLALGAVAANYSSLRQLFVAHDAAPTSDDPIAEVVNLGS
jgi:hypothetical protein